MIICVRPLARSYLFADMSDRIQAFVLSKVEYGDKTLIVDLYSLQSGRLTASIYSTKKSRNRFYFSPLSLLELNLFVSKKAKLNKISDVKSELPSQMAQNSAPSSAYRYFIAEVLQKTLSLENPDPQLFNFIYSFILDLYNGKIRATFINDFLEGLSPHLGLDLQEIKRQGGNPADYGLDFNQSDWQRLITDQPISTKERLNLLIQFYGQHFEGMKHLKTRSILGEVFG